jgi:hypothetical protein
MQEQHVDFDAGAISCKLMETYLHLAREGPVPVPAIALALDKRSLRVHAPAPTRWEVGGGK